MSELNQKIENLVKDGFDQDGYIINKGLRNRTKMAKELLETINNSNYYNSGLTNQQYWHLDCLTILANPTKTL